MCTSAKRPHSEAAAVPVPVGTTAESLRKLSAAIDATHCTQLVFLGDLWHSKEGRKDEILTSLRSWRECYPKVDMVLVEGNHDRRSGVLPPELGITTVGEPFSEGPFALCHYPADVEGSYCLSGHIHPAVSLSAPARQSLRLPCFWFTDRYAVLPAFGEFTGTADIEPRSSDRVFAIADDRLHAVRLVH
jgi:DNA ligase-associated metallophosphoesterase